VTIDPYRCTTAFFQELAGQGVEHVLVSPGSRSTPLAISANRTAGLQVHIHLDERSAAYWALGLAKASGRPVGLVCTSGTAAANYLPAVVEAHYSEVPLLILTADRPPELRDRGAGQTIDQLDIYGPHTRWWSDLPVAGAVGPDWFRSTAARAVDAATGLRPGPVHLNFPLREPLEPRDTDPAPAQPPIRIDRTASGETSAVLDEIAELERGLVLAGPMHRDHAELVSTFCRATGWPLLAEPLSQLRRTLDGVVVTAHHDHLLRTAWAEGHVPDVVVRIGQPMTCKPLRLWLERHRPRHVLVDSGGSWTDASVTVTDVVRTGIGALGSVTPRVRNTSWGKEWAEADRIAEAAADRILDAEPLMEAVVARELGRALPSDAVLYVSNSMPVRDIDSFLRPRTEPLTCLGNRGASGIDGVVSSAAGVASTGKPTTLLIGDLAVLHDVGGLMSAAHHGIDLTLVVPNNDGGGIFSFLPIAAQGEAIDFETLFRTPQSQSLAALTAALGGEHHHVTEIAELRQLAAAPTSGLRLIEIPVDRDTNVDQHRRILTAIDEALR